MCSVDTLWRKIWQNIGLIKIPSLLANKQHSFLLVLNIQSLLYLSSCEKIDEISQRQVSELVGLISAV